MTMTEGTNIFEINKIFDEIARQKISLFQTVFG